MSSLRREKSARLKYLLGNAIGQRLLSENFEAIKVTDLCEEVEISKVTFFKYFNSKEELLRYYFRVWCLQIGVDLHSKPKKGIEGIHFIFEEVHKSLHSRPTFITGLISYMVRDDRIRAPYTLSRLERNLFFPEVEEIEKIELLSLEQFLDNFVLEAVLSNNITTTDPKFVTHQLHTFMLGSIVDKGYRHKLPDRMEMRIGVDSLLKSFRK